ncbi:MAG TPA: cyclic nucleotide-binding domain-containing protein, partial [Anaerolineaceae bacterium]|nr:cyclic nucleotide-binding domain-containing protein [Anaerolineaceae bacterium]
MRITQAKPEQLLGLALFNSFPPEGLTELVSTCALKVYEDGEILFFEGDPAESVLLVLAGRAVLFRGSELGRELVLSRLG